MMNTYGTASSTVTELAQLEDDSIDRKKKNQTGLSAGKRVDNCNCCCCDNNDPADTDRYDARMKPVYSSTLSKEALEFIESLDPKPVPPVPPEPPYPDGCDYRCQHREDNYPHQHLHYTI